MRSYLVFSLLIMLSGCASAVEFADHYENGAVKSAGAVISRAQEGPWTYYWSNGRIKAKGNYARDEMVGRWSWYYENGNKRREGEFAAEHSEGNWRYWYADGTLQATGWFNKGQKTGEWSTYATNGNLIQRGHYIAGKPGFQWTFFYPNGREKARGWFRDDATVGPWQFFSEEGALSERQYPLPDGVRLVRERWDNGPLRRAGFVSQGVPTGRWVTWHDTGARRLSGDWAEGVLSGPWRAFTPNGKLLGTGPVAKGRPTGEWQWNENGQLSRQIADSTARPLEVWSGVWAKAAEFQTSNVMAAVECWFAEAASPHNSADQVLREVSRQPAPPVMIVESPNLAPEPIPTRRVIHGLARWLWAYTEKVKNTDFSFYSTGSGAPGRGDRSAAQRLHGRNLAAMKFMTSDNGMVDLGAANADQWTLLIILRGFAGQVCPYCGPQLKALARFKADFDGLGVRVVAVYPGPKDGVDLFLGAYRNTYGKDDPPQYTILYDIDSRLARELGILNAKLESPILARPTTLLLDEHATVQYAYVGDHDQDRPPAKSLVDKIVELRKR